MSFSPSWDLLANWPTFNHKSEKKQFLINQIIKNQSKKIKIVEPQSTFKDDIKDPKHLNGSYLIKRNVLISRLIDYFDHQYGETTTLFYLPFLNDFLISLKPKD
jgi:hypothetical protein